LSDEGGIGGELLESDGGDPDGFIEGVVGDLEGTVDACAISAGVQGTGSHSSVNKGVEGFAAGVEDEHGVIGDNPEMA
jgi:hypothetical protein